ncbi:MAG TPA: tetratricopeptide repeat protein, partial [Ktedonobacteraceae bacterium]
EAAYQHALAIRRAVLGEQHPHTATSFYDLALLYQVQSKYAESLALFEQAQAIWQKTFGPKHPNTRNAQSSYEETLYLMKRRASIISPSGHPRIPVRRQKKTNDYKQCSDTEQ